MEFIIKRYQLILDAQNGKYIRTNMKWLPVAILKVANDVSMIEDISKHQ